MTTTEKVEKMRCLHCGREGTQGFTVNEPHEVTVAGVTFETDRLVECSGRAACRRRIWRAMTPESRAYNGGSE